MTWPFYSRTKSSRRIQTSALKGRFWSRSGGLGSLLKEWPPSSEWATVSRQLRDPVGQSLGPSGVFWSSGFPPWSGRTVTTRECVLGRNLWSGLWYGTVSGAGIHTASSLPGNQETSGMKHSGQMGEGQLHHKDLILKLKSILFSIHCINAKLT